MEKRIEKAWEGREREKLDDVANVPQFKLNESKWKTKRRKKERDGDS